jgi:hypothetical protein
MSIIRDHILMGGGMDFAHKAAAAAVFELAQDGYITMRFSTSRIEAVRLTRTAKPMHDLHPEQCVLLESIFEKADKKNKQVYLMRPNEVPIAASLAAYARALLVADGSIRPLQPRRVYRWVSGVFYATLVAGTVIALAISQQIEVLFIALVISGIAWAFFEGFTLGLKHARVFRTQKGKDRYHALNSLRASSRYNTYRTNYLQRPGSCPMSYCGSGMANPAA